MDKKVLISSLLALITPVRFGVTVSGPQFVCQISVRGYCTLNSSNNLMRLIIQSFGPKFRAFFSISILTLILTFFSLVEVRSKNIYGPQNVGQPFQHFRTIGKWAILDFLGKIYFSHQKTMKKRWVPKITLRPSFLPF